MNKIIIKLIHIHHTQIRKENRNKRRLNKMLMDGSQVKKLQSIKTMTFEIS